MPVNFKYLYKYRSWPNVHAERMLRYNEIRFAGFDEFNDPFDCHIPLRYDLMTDDQLREFGKRNGEPDPDQFVCFCRSNPNYLPSKRKELMESNLREFGILCLSINRANLLMWSHYANQHAGICVGFDWQLLEAHWEELAYEETLVDEVPVAYRSDFPVIIPNDRSDEEYIKCQIENKAIGWACEQEIRYLRMGAPENLKLPSGIIAEVILGCKMSVKERENVRAVLRGSSGNVRILQASREKDAFGLEFHEGGFG